MEIEKMSKIKHPVQQDGTFKKVVPNVVKMFQLKYNSRLQILLFGNNGHKETRYFFKSTQTFLTVCL